MTDGGHEHARRRYLAAKRSVDERARNRRVRDRLLAALPAEPRVAEAGCGAGLTVPALYEWGVRPSSYHGVDVDAGIVAFARHVAPRVLRRRGFDAVETGRGCRVGDADLEFAAGDALQALPAVDSAGEVDLLLAQSFLDLVPLGSALDVAEAVVSPDGLVYAPLTFDGDTVFQPAHPADDRVLAAFHDAIDATPGRDSRAARHVREHLRERDAHVEAVGSSDWIVRPVDGAYREDERFFLGCILSFVADAVSDVDGAEEWSSTRHAQLARGELTYVARNHDLLFRPGGTAGADHGE
nr:class I SAM-dependent methyltransferase [Halorubellus salinus]